LSLPFGAFLGIEHFTPPWDVVFLPLFNLLVFLYRILFTDLALAIIVFVVVVRLILWPLFVRQIRSQKEMQRMQPLVREIRRKHKGNNQKIFEEQQALYREHGVSQLGGCLPLLLQLPILFSLYQVLLRASGVISSFQPNDSNRAAFEALQQAGVVQAVAGQANTYHVAVDGACNLPQYAQLPQFLPVNCQLIDPLKLHASIDSTVGWLFGLDLARVDHIFALPVLGFSISALALVAGIFQFVQAKMTSPRPDPDDPTSSTTTTLTYVFPLMMVFWGAFFPSGLILYYLVLTVTLIVQQYFIMGWGNLFPIFGWHPSWAPASDEALPKRPLPRSVGTARDDSNGSAVGRSQPTTGQGSAPGSNRQQPRSGSRRRRGRRR
jgi:YidC/Oxa1 family membrane protein insertase